MADEDKEKAEKLAAAKKRFEQLKKEQQKKGKKGGAKKKDDAAAEAKVDEVAAVEDPVEAPTAVEEEPLVVETSQAVPSEPSPPTLVTPASSISAQSRQRSESFRQGNSNVGYPGSGDINDVYRKQAARIDELEKENKAFKDQQQEAAARLAKAEEEVETLREGSSDVAELKTKAKETDRLQTELASTQRQLAQAQQAAKGISRRASGPSPDLTEQLASKTSTIESLELEISNLRNHSNTLQANLSERDASAKELQDRAVAAETATESVQQELDALKVSIAFPSDETKEANEDPEALTKRITVLESDLRTANTNLDAAAKRATSLEQKIEALTKMHRDATTTSQAKDKEISDLRTQIRRRDRPSHVRDASEFELGDEETETGALQTRIRALEAENFDLRRNVWREKRAEMQPGIDDDANPTSESYEDIDLDGPYSAAFGRKGSGPKPIHSTFQDVITSGISAFTGRSREPTKASGYGASPRARKMSLALLSEDGDEFDPDAFRLAQEEEAKRRIERVKEVKRGLENWKGWKLDLFDTRQNGIGGGRDCGPVFEI